MYHIRPNLIVGFHGCDEAVCNALLNNPNRIKISRERFDWLGNGMYFWENNYRRALDWANEKHKRGKITKPAVIGAVIELGYCCDFLNAEHILMFKRSYERFVTDLRQRGKELYESADKAKGRSKNRMIGELDCFIIEHMHEEIAAQIKEDIEQQGFSEQRLPDSVRGAFIEGKPVFEGSGIHEKTHIQIAIRNPNCIKGFFLPRKERISDGFHYDISDISEDGFLVSEPGVPYNV
ncbi:hypothetical protein L3C95_22640 [Chitinophaga filiformis]|uniref:hypothetical protein n=1 Tax=Chitinophaga filiformis TaxID=104663 RepID=UPI001F2DE45C|nr:hypothetical protein [Chitinophaga filiformis]MCF6405714.1 hypothetical protein [Chitinophaga filiformis]